MGLPAVFAAFQQFPLRPHTSHSPTTSGINVLSDVRRLYFDQQCRFHRKILPSDGCGAGPQGAPFLLTAGRSARSAVPVWLEELPLCAALHVRRAEARGLEHALPHGAQLFQGPWERLWPFLTRPPWDLSRSWQGHPIPTRGTDFPSTGGGRRVRAQPGRPDDPGTRMRGAGPRLPWLPRRLGRLATAHASAVKSGAGGAAELCGGAAGN